jgi:hypothetical protein
MTWGILVHCFRICFAMQTGLTLAARAAQHCIEVSGVHMVYNKSISSSNAHYPHSQVLYQP